MIACRINVKFFFSPFSLLFVIDFRANIIGDGIIPAAFRFSLFRISAPAMTGWSRCSRRRARKRLCCGPCVASGSAGVSGIIRDERRSTAVDVARVLCRIVRARLVRFLLSLHSIATGICLRTNWPLCGADVGYVGRTQHEDAL